MGISRSLTAKDLSQTMGVRFVELGYATAACQSPDQLNQILQRLQEIFPIDGIVGGTGQIEGVSSLNDIWANSVVPVIKLGPVSRHNWPVEFLSQYFKANMIRRDAQLYECFRTFRPQLWIDLYASQRHPFDPRIKRGFDRLFVEMIFDYRLSHSVRFGQVDNPKQISGLVANFRSKREAVQFSGLLEAFLPYLHQAFLRVSGMSSGQGSIVVPLTTREREALLWLVEGKSNHEIGQLMSISDRTVKFYMGNLMKKLKAHNRSQLVANAFGMHSGLTH